MSTTDPHAELPLDPDSPTARPLHLQVGTLLAVFVGGAGGTLARYEIALAEPTRPGHWPTGTLLANIVGAFVLGLLLEALARRGPDVGLRQRLRLLLGSGFCGGFTTYSTLAVETGLLLRADDGGLALGYLATTVGAGLLATAAGVTVAIVTTSRGPA